LVIHCKNWAKRTKQLGSWEAGRLESWEARRGGSWKDKGERLKRALGCEDRALPLRTASLEADLR